MPVVEWLPLGSRSTLLAQDGRASQNRIAIQKPDFRRRQKKSLFYQEYLFKLLIVLFGYDGTAFLPLPMEFCSVTESGFSGDCIVFSSDNKARSPLRAIHRCPVPREHERRGKSLRRWGCCDVRAERVGRLLRE